jgi:hypothetical protein
VDVSENEWAKACNLREQYWLYVVFDCASPRPRLQRIKDPWGVLTARIRGFTLDQEMISRVAEED